jgi:hypothetical protein
MCNTFCGCAGEIRNTGVPNRQQKIEDGTSLIYVQKFADDGTENVIKRSDTLNQAFFQAKVNNPDPSKRWYVLGNFINVANERADSTFESFSNGNSSRTQKGIRTYLGWLVGYNPIYASVIESFRCFEGGVFTIDDCGQIIGIFCPDNADPQNDVLKPQPLNKGSIDSKVILASDAAAAKVQMSFEFSQLMRDAQLRLLTNEEMGDANLLELIKLQPIKTKITTPSTTGFVAQIQLDYDSFTAIPITGLVPADFRLFNRTTNAVVVITSTAEAPVGTYTFVFAAQGSGNVLSLTQSVGTVKPFGVTARIAIP